MERPTVGLLTDFGVKDTYVGLMKCVMAKICPEIRHIDLCHEVPPQDILSAAYLADTAVPHLPEGGVLMAVIDPGVGSGRRAVAVELDSCYLVGPDNGLFALALRYRTPKQVVALENDEYFRSEVSETFHGRDIFAPISGHIADGVELEELGPQLDPDELERLPSSDPFYRNSRIEAHVIHIDGFGNLITNLSESGLDDWLDGAEPVIRLQDEETEMELQATFSDSTTGRPLAYIGSTGQLEIAVNNGNAERYFGANQGTTVIVERAEDGG